MKECVITLKIRYEPTETSSPSKWDWAEVLDLPDHDDVVVLKTIEEARDVEHALVCLFAAVDGVNENWAKGDLAGAVNRMNDERAYAEATCVGAGLLTGRH